jgi:asparagine synthase (glutamine-hydrolysing)
MRPIFGVIDWDGAPVDPVILARMTSALAPYGSTQCLSAPGTGGRSTLVADARIDDGDEIARAVDARGDEAADRLRGPFAFAHWDHAARRLLLARSPLSERPLFYHASPRRFAFASMPQALFAAGAGTAIDEEFLADYLAHERFEPGRTLYRDIRRVPAGHVLIVTARDTRVRRFWPPETIPELRLSSDAAYVEALNDLFARVIDGAVKSDGGVGLMLSGGLDSSSVAAVAAPALAGTGKRLSAFTEVPRPGFDGEIVAGRYADETPLVQSLARRYDTIDLSLVRTDRRFFLDDLAPVFDAGQAPFPSASNLVWFDAVMGAARDRGVRVLLHGGAGNLTMGWDGLAALAHPTGRGQWRTAWREARALSRTTGRSPLHLLVSNGLLPWMPAPIYDGVQRLRSPRSSRTAARHPWFAHSAIHPAFARAHRVHERAEAKDADSRLRVRADTRERRWHALLRGGELLDGFPAACQRRFGVELRDPTADSRLVEFCLSLPEDQFLRQGRTRWLIRRAMADRLPPEILDNPRRGLQAADWFERMRDHQPQIAATLDRLDASDLVRRAIDVPRLRRLAAALPSANAGGRDTLASYRGTLEQGLMVGTFVCWAEQRAGRLDPNGRIP